MKMFVSVDGDTSSGFCEMRAEMGHFGCSDRLLVMEFGPGRAYKFRVDELRRAVNAAWALVRPDEKEPA